MFIMLHSFLFAKKPWLYVDCLYKLFKFFNMVFKAFPTLYFCVLFNMAFLDYSDLPKVPFCLKYMSFLFD